MLKMKVPELRTRYEEVFGEATRSGNREHLIKRIAWRLQAREQGGLSERARRRAEELADDADLRTRAPRAGAASGEALPPTESTLVAPFRVARGSPLPMPGTLLKRDYRGRTIVVKVLSNGVECEGKVYRSLSAVANAVTGSHWNGSLFFGLGRSGRSPRRQQEAV